MRFLLSTERFCFAGSQDLLFLRALLELGQDHLFQGWPLPGMQDLNVLRRNFSLQGDDTGFEHELSCAGVADHEKVRLVEQLRALDENYPSGLPGYIRSAKRLLADAQAGTAQECSR